MMRAVATENYLKAIYNAAEWSDQPVTVSVLAKRLGLAPSSISEHVRKLTDRGLVTHAPYGAVELTAQGRRIALAMVRKHRLIEVFLVDYLGYGWDQVHDEAQALEHAVSDMFVDRLDDRLSHPEVDPHGDPIPRADGSLPALTQRPLASLEPGTEALVARVWDDDPELLRALQTLGISIGTHIKVQSRHESLGTITLEFNGTSATLAVAASHAIRVTTAPAPSQS